MKSYKLSILVALLFVALTAFIFVSCQKDAIPNQSQTSSPLVNNEEAEDLPEDDEIQFNYDENNDLESVVYTEPENIEVHPDNAALLGFEELEIASGTYTININSNAPYGELVLDVESYAVGSGGAGGAGIGIRIAKRIKMSCGDNHGGPFICLCGVGVRCGFITAYTADPGGIMGANGYEATFDATFNSSNSTLTLKFDDYVDWIDADHG